MAVKNILPSLQADEKSAQLHVRALPMPSMLGNAGALLSDAGKNIQGLGARLTLAIKAERDRQNEQAGRIRQESDRLKLNEQINAYRNSVYTLLDESMKLTGTEAVNSTKNFMDAVAKKREICAAGLNPNLLREFNFEAEQIDFAAKRNILNHEEKNLREANIRSRQLSIQNISANYARTGDPENMPQLYEAIEGLYSATYGDLPDDKRIDELLVARAALEQEGGKEEDVAKIDEELENLGMRTKAFYEMRDTVVEQTFLARFDYLVKQNDLAGARRFYLEHEGRIGDVAKNKMLQVLNDTERTETNRYKANVLLNSKVVTEDGVDSMYWTPEMEARGIEAVEELQNKIIEDPDHAGDYQEQLQVFKSLLTAKKNAGQARFAADLMSITNDLDFNTGDIMGIAQNLSSLKDKINATSSPSLKRELEALYTKYQQHYDTVTENAKQALYKELENDPARKSFVTAFIVDAATREHDFYVKIGEGRYNLKTKEGRDELRKKYIITLDNEGKQVGLFTPKELDFLDEISKNPNNNYISQAAGDLVQAINRKTGSERNITVPQLLAFAPEMVDQVLRWRAKMSNDYNNLKPGQLEEQDKEMIDTIISQMVDIPWAKDKSFADTITNFFNDNNGEINVTEIEQYVRGLVYPENDVKGELNKSIIATSNHPGAKRIRESLHYEESADVLPETSEVFPTDSGASIINALNVETDEEKAAREAAEKAKSLEKEKRKEENARKLPLGGKTYGNW